MISNYLKTFLMFQPVLTRFNCLILKFVLSLSVTINFGMHDYLLYIETLYMYLIMPLFYLGNVFIGIKDAVFEHSTPLRHATEIYNILQSQSLMKPILFVYSDGGPDHRLTYMSVKLTLICLFLKLDLDYLCAGRTAPYHSWRNPVERVMSILNLGLQ